MRTTLWQQAANARIKQSTPTTQCSRMDIAKTRFSTLLLFLTWGIGAGGWVASIPGIRSSLALSASQLGLALPGMALGSMCATFFTANLIRRFGSARTCAVTGCLFVMALSGPVLAVNQHSLLGALVVLGLATGTLDVCMTVRASEQERASGRPMMSSFLAAGTLGLLLGLAQSGLSTLAGYPLWVGTLASVGLAGLAVTLSVALGTKQAQMCLASQQHVPVERQQSRRVRLWPSTTVLWLGACLGATLILQGGASDWGGIYLISLESVADGLAGTGFACFLVALLLSRLLGDLLVKAMGPIRLVCLGAGFVALGYTLMVALPQAWAICLGFAIVGLGLGNVQPVVMSLAGREPDGRKSVARVTMIAYGLVMLSPPVMGGVTQMVGLRVSFCCLVLLASLLALAFPVIIAYAVRRRSAS